MPLRVPLRRCIQHAYLNAKRSAIGKAWRHRAPPPGGESVSRRPLRHRQVKWRGRIRRARASRRLDVSPVRARGQRTFRTPPYLSGPGYETPGEEGPRA